MGYMNSYEFAKDYFNSKIEAKEKTMEITYIDGKKEVIPNILSVQASLGHQIIYVIGKSKKDIEKEVIKKANNIEEIVVYHKEVNSDNNE
jgi:hypothetical protein